MSPTGESGRESAGFTLLELLVTLALAGLLISLLPPLLGHGGEAARLRTETRSLAAALGMARSEAIAQARETGFILDLDAHRYGIAGHRLDGSLDAGMAVEMRMAASDRLASRRAMIRFFPDGSASGAEIRLGNGAGRRVIAIDWLTGRVTTHDGAGL